MSEDVMLRLAVVGAVTVVAIAAAMVLRRGRAWRRRPVVIDGYGAGTYFFSSPTCATCAAVREMVAGNPAVVEVAFEGGDRFPAQVERVPAIARLGEGGAGWIVYGTVSARRLRRWLGDP